jgi:hypothetical protein
MYDLRLESIDKEIIRLSEVCINADVLVRQLRTLTMSQEQYTIDNMIILYTHVYNHVHYLLDPNEIHFKRTILNLCIRGIDMLHTINLEPTLDQDLYPKYLRDMALTIVSKLKDELS